MIGVGATRAAFFFAAFFAGTLFVAAEGGPPAPPMALREGVLRIDEHGNAITPLIRSDSALIYRASREGAKYSHHPHLGVFQGALYAMWSSGEVDEDSASQQVLYSSSKDGLTWSAPRVFAGDPDGADGPLRLTAGGWWSDGEKLMGCYTVFSGRPTPSTQSGSDFVKWLGDLNVMARSSVDGDAWGEPRRLADDLLVNDGPREAPGGGWLMTGETQTGRPRLLRSGGADGLAGWEDVTLLLPELPRAPNEMTWFARREGGITLVFRDDNRSQKLYAAGMSADLTQTTAAQITHFPDARAKTSALNLPGGEAILIGNPSPNGSRIPLAVAVSRNGFIFDKFFGIQAAQTKERHSGKNKGPGYHYPDGLVWRGHLYVIYSVNKEDIGVTRIGLDWLAAELESGP